MLTLSHIFLRVVNSMSQIHSVTIATENTSLLPQEHFYKSRVKAVKTCDNIQPLYVAFHVPPSTACSLTLASKHLQKLAKVNFDNGSLY